MGRRVALTALISDPAFEAEELAATQDAPPIVIQDIAPPRGEQPQGEPLAGTDDNDTHFSELERKEARLRIDQIEDLTRLAKRLNRARRGQPGRRITENTLIRVAIDHLLDNQAKLTGPTETQLRENLRNGTPA